jgi:hypothetical protein
MNKLLSQIELKKHLMYHPDTGEFTRLTSLSSSVKVGENAGGIGYEGYINIRVNGAKYRAHRLAWLYVHGSWPQMHIDHIDGIKSNNKILNLRECNRTQNMRNKGSSKNNNSGFKGVSWKKDANKWVAQARLNGKKIYLGYFDIPQEANAAYQAFAKENHGEFYKDAT